MNQTNAYTGCSFRAGSTGQGRVNKVVGGTRNEYFINDHLGNTRVVYSDRNNNGVIELDTLMENCELLEEYHYYPFGMQFDMWWSPQKDTITLNRYRYNPVKCSLQSLPASWEFHRASGKEQQRELGWDWYNYGARYYDASVARFGGVDPHAARYSNISPYAYVANNPLVYTDPDGRDIIVKATRDDAGDKYKYEILKGLQSLTDDKLAIRGNRVVIIEKGSGDKEHGTEVIRNLIEGFEKDGDHFKFDVTIQEKSGIKEKDEQLGYQAFTDPDNHITAANGIGSNSKVTIRADVRAQFTTLDGDRQVSPFNITLGHELFHADHIAKGVMASRAVGPNNEYSQEEKNAIRRENIIRAEQGIKVFRRD